MEVLMTAGLYTAVALGTLADLLDHLGGIAPERVRLHPAPGTATGEDVLNVHDQAGWLCELVDGVLVEKARGFRESFLAAALIIILGNFVRPRNLGLVTAPDGVMRLAAGLVRIPDVAFIAWDRLPNRRVSTAPIPALAPHLAIEVLSAGNTTREIAWKCREYFAAGVQLAWLVDPETRTVVVHTPPEDSTTLHEEDTLEGGMVLTGFMLSVREFFAELDRQGNG
jgi:Uma2 family endonuclease